MPSFMVEVFFHQSFCCRIQVAFLQGFTIGLEDVSDIFGQNFAQFHSPLIITVQLPNETFNRGPVLINRKELTTLIGIEFTSKEETQRWPVSWEFFVIQKCFWSLFCDELFFALANS